MPKAKAAAVRALALDETLAEAHTSLGRVLAVYDWDWTSAEKEYKRGLALRAAGDIDGCIQALETASRAPKLRFGTSWLIARLYRERDMMPQALEWLERASQAPAPTTDESHQLLFELAEGLEKVGEVARALAVCMELQCEAGSYRDVDARIDRLTKVQAGS